ncbi:MAG: cupredoxin domain-containing protein [Candidatus Yanofskybacteria bacterium]|nr:cupredoxin domain-containing protein [Candidatus Yanofskybacteria bacterium]
MDKIIVTISGILGILFTYWFFLMKKNSGVAKKTKLNFIRKDSNSCLEEVVLGDFGIRKYLPLNEEVTIEITPQKAGKFTYSCGMNMFHGKIIVVDPELNRGITE